MQLELADVCVQDYTNLGAAFTPPLQPSIIYRDPIAPLEALGMEYAHTQNAPLKYIIYAVAMLLFASAWITRNDGVVTAILSVAACVVLVFALSFHTLTVADEGDRLAIRYGPLPLFRTSIPYANITSVEPGRSSLIDGFGIHYVPCRGWTYNLWGYQCAVIQQGKKTVRIGTDDLENLVEFLRPKTQSEKA